MFFNFILQGCAIELAWVCMSCISDERKDDFKSKHVYFYCFAEVVSLKNMSLNKHLAWCDCPYSTDLMTVVSPSIRFCHYVCKWWLNTQSLIVFSIHREEFRKRPAAACLNVRWHWPTVICLNLHTSTNNVPCLVDFWVQHLKLPKSTHLMAVMLFFCFASLCSVLPRWAIVPLWQVVLHVNILYSYHVNLSINVDVFWNKLF